MKNTIKFLTVLVAVFSFTLTSCDEVESLADVNLKSSISGKYNLNFNEETEDKIDESLLLNLADEGDVSEYINKLKKVNITRITYQISAFTGDNYVDMNVGFFMDGNEIVAPMDYNLGSQLGVVYEITDASILQTISTTLLNKKQVTFKLQGAYSSMSAATAEIKVTVYFDAVANPL